MLDFHRRLLADSVRTLAFRDAIRQLVRPDDVVLDLGSGTRILAMFACEAGARRVFAVDEDHMADVTRLLARENGFAIEVFHKRSTDIELPEPATLLITETLGTIALDEDILGSVIDARRRLLTLDARILPSRIAMSFVPVDVRVEQLEFASYGFDFSALRMLASNTIHRIDVEPSARLAEPRQLLDIDLTTLEEPRVGGGATFTATRDGMLHGFASWFDVTLAPGVTLSTRTPRSTHWEHAFLPLETPIAVERGMPIALRVEALDATVWRWRGSAGDVRFDQATGFSMPPCE